MGKEQPSSWPPPLLPGPLLDGSLLGGPQAQLSPPYPHSDLPFVSLAVLARQKGVPRHRSTRTPSPRTSSPHPLQTQPVPQVRSLLTRSPPMSDPPLPDSLAGALRHGLVGSCCSTEQSGLFAFCSEASPAPTPFPRSPGLQVPPVDVEADTWLALPALSLLRIPRASVSHLEDGCHPLAGTRTPTSGGWISFSTMSY